MVRFSLIDLGPPGGNLARALDTSESSQIRPPRRIFGCLIGPSSQQGQRCRGVSLNVGLYGSHKQSVAGGQQPTMDLAQALPRLRWKPRRSNMPSSFGPSPSGQAVAPRRHLPLGGAPRLAPSFATCRWPVPTALAYLADRLAKRALRRRSRPLPAGPRRPPPPRVLAQPPLQPLPAKFRASARLQPL